MGQFPGQKFGERLVEPGRVDAESVCAGPVGVRLVFGVGGGGGGEFLRGGSGDGDRWFDYLSGADEWNCGD
jgi:hypothetical protein